MASITIKKILGQQLNMLERLPDGYDPAIEYPVFLYLPGAGEIGTDPSKLYVHGPFQAIHDGDVIPDLPIIIVAIQNINPNPRPDEINGYITYLKFAYNTRYVGFCDISRGGQDAGWYMEDNECFLAQICAVAFISAEGVPTTVAGFPATFDPSLFVKYNIPVVFGIGTADSFYNANKAKYESLVAAGANAIWAEFVGAGHGDPVWSGVYAQDPSNNPFGKIVGKSIYKWFSDWVASIRTLPTIQKVTVSYANGTTATLP